MDCRSQADAKQPGQDSPRDPELNVGADQRPGDAGAAAQHARRGGGGYGGPSCPPPGQIFEQIIDMQLIQCYRFVLKTKNVSGLPVA